MASVLQAGVDRLKVGRLLVPLWLILSTGLILAKLFSFTRLPWILLLAPIWLPVLTVACLLLAAMWLDSLAARKSND